MEMGVLSVTLSACNCKSLENPRTFSFGEVKFGHDFFSSAYTRVTIAASFILTKKL